MTPEYRENFQKGLEYQDFTVRKLYEAGIPLVGFSSFRYQVEMGENMAGIEIKLDGRMSETGSVYFETSEKSDADNEEYVPSGIYRSDNTWLYAIGDYSVLYICGKDQLRRLFERENVKNETFARFVETPTSRGMLLPQRYVEERLALKTIRFT